MILLALSSTLKWAWAIGLGTHYSNIADRPEHLNRAPTHTIQRWKGTYTMAFISNSDPIKFPNFPESSYSSQPSLYCLSLSFVVQKVVLCRRKSVWAVCQVLTAGWLEPSRCLLAPGVLACPAAADLGGEDGCMW